MAAFSSGVVDQRLRLGDGLDEAPLPFGQYQMQRIPHVGGEGITGDPVQRQVRPVKAGFAPMCRVAVVVHVEVFDFGHRVLLPNAQLACGSAAQPGTGTHPENRALTTAFLLPASGTFTRDDTHLIGTDLTGTDAALLAIPRIARWALLLLMADSAQRPPATPHCSPPWRASCPTGHSAASSPPLCVPTSQGEQTDLDVVRTQGLAPDGRVILAGRARLRGLVRPCKVYRRDDGGIVGVPNLQAPGIRLRRPSNG